MRPLEPSGLVGSLAAPLRVLVAVGIWALPVAFLACGSKDDSGDTDGGTDAGSGDLQRVSLGSHDIADTGAFTPEISVDVPSGATSAMLYCGGYGDAALGSLWTLDDPAGSRVWDADAPDFDTFRADFLDDMSTVLIPATSRVPIASGAWTAKWWVGKGNGGNVTCEAVFRLDPVSADAGIAVDLVFVAPIDAATAEADPNFQAALAEFEAQWGSGGLAPTYRYVDFAGDVARFTVVDVTDDDYSEFNDLLRTANPSAARTITFFFVEEIANNSAGGSTILGLAGGPPGAATVHQTSKSGVIVSAVDYETAPADVGKIMAHEGGHFLGLYHTSERDGAKHDPIDDTPQCTGADDADGNGTMNTAECGGKGAENVMWWTLTQVPPSFSGDQSVVLRSNPVAD